MNKTRARIPVFLLLKNTIIFFFIKKNVKPLKNIHTCMSMHLLIHSTSYEKRIKELIG